LRYNIKTKGAIMSEKIKKLRKQIKEKTYNLEKAIEGAADRIAEYPQALLWR
jgi:hypothetical protein